MNAAENFRANVKQLIKIDQIRQKDLASKAQITEANLTRILQGKSMPALDTCDAIADALGVPIGRLTQDVEIYSTVP